MEKTFSFQSFFTKSFQSLFSNNQETAPPPDDDGIGEVADTIGLMSVYHPFPLRLDTAGSSPGDPVSTNIQYDACFQIGEFASPAYPDSGIDYPRKGNKVVILIPLKVDSDPTGPGGLFINSLAQKLPNILGGHPDILTGYPEVPAATGSDWGLSKIVELDRPFYTWLTSYNKALDPPRTRVIVMSEPINIAAGDLTNIQSLPITPPEDAIQDVPKDRIYYHPAPPRDGCKKPKRAASNLPPVFSSFAGFLTEPDSKDKQKEVAKILLSVLTGTVATIILAVAIYFGLKLAMGPIGVQFGKLGESLASIFGSARRSIGRIPSPMSGQPNVLGRAAQGTRRSLANSLGIGSKFTRRSPRSLNTPTSAAEIANKKPEVPLIPEGTFSVTNPLDATKHKQITGDLGLGLGTPTSASQIANKKPEVPLIPTGTFSITNPGYPNGPPSRTRRETDRPTDPAEARALAAAKKNALRRATQRNPRVNAMDAARKKAQELKDKRMKSADALRRITPTSTGLLTASELNRNRPGASDSFRMSENRRLRDRQEAKLNDDDEPAARPRRNVGMTPSPLLESEMERTRQIEKRAGRRGRRNNRRKPLKTGRKLS
jgi:hypothetical protein